MGLCLSKAGLVEVEARGKVPRNSVPTVDNSLDSEQKLHDAPSDAALAAQLTESLLQGTGSVALPLKTAPAPAGLELPSCGGVPLGCPFPPELCCPWNEDARQKSLRELGILGQLPEPRFDTVVELMKSIFQVQVAAVSLVDWEEISFHARAGEWACRAGRAGSFCDWIFIPPNPTMLIVEDATKDVRFQQNKYVEGPPGIRFYAGAPLVASDSGHRYGTLCVIDYKPRHFAAEQYSILAHFAEIVTRELERSKVLRWQQHVLQAATLQHMTMLRAMDCFSEGIMLCDPSQPGWPILYCNDAWVATTGVSRDLALSAGGFWKLFAAKQIDGALLSAAEAGAAAGEAAAAAAAAAGTDGSSTAGAAAAGAAAGAAAAAAPWAAAAAGTARDAVLASAAAQKRTFRAQVAPRDAAAASGAAPALLFEFKPSGTGEHLREDMPHIGIPGFVGFGSGSGGPIATGTSSSSSSIALGSNSALATGGSVIGTGGSAFTAGNSAVATGGGSIASGSGSRASGSGGSIVPPGSPSAPRESGHSYYFGIVKGRDLAVLLPGSQPSSATVADGSLSGSSAPQTTISSDGGPAETSAAAALGSVCQQAVRGSGQPSLQGSQAAAAAARPPADAAKQASADGPQQQQQQGAAAGVVSPQAPLPPVPSFQQMRPKVMEEVVLGPLLGCGSNGRCYRGVWHGGHVAVKILDCWVQAPEGGAADAAGAGGVGELQTEPVLEAVLSKSLSHPHIVTTFDYAVSTQEPGEGSSRGTVHQQVWIIQGYCNRGSLFHAIESGMLRGPDGQPSLLAIMQTASEIAGALCYIHGRDILHGDLTPNNILLTSSNKDARRFTTQVADFGLARVVTGSGGVTTETIGTVTHMPPEMLLGGSLSQATDVYSFGVILWEMWEGRRAWKGLSAPQIMHAVGSGSLALAPQETAPDWLQDLMRRCLSRDPAQRPSFEAMLELLLAKVKAMRQAQKQEDGRRRERRRSLESKRSMEPKRSQELKKGGALGESKKSMELPPGL